MTVKVMKVTVAMSIATWFGSAMAQQTVSINLGQQESFGSSQTESDTVKVQGRGMGIDKDSALKDAYRDAVERAVGLYVDAETVADNDQILKDQILTQSNAYITDYRELGVEKLDNGLVQLRILATVQKRALTAKLSGVMPTQTIALNTGLQNVHAQLVTKARRAEDAAALLKNALDGINPMKSLMIASMRPATQKIITADDATARGRGRGRGTKRLRDVIAAGGAPTVVVNPDGTTMVLGPDGSTVVADPDDGPVGAANGVTLRYIFEVKLDRAKYFSEFVPNLKKVLEQISLTPPTELRLMELMPADVEENQHCRGLKDYLAQGYESNGWDDVRSNVELFINRTSNCSDCSAYLDPIHVYSISWQGNNWVWPFGHDRYRPKSGGAFRWQEIRLTVGDFETHYRKDKVYFALITSLNANCTNGKVTMYELDKSVIPALNEWREGLIDAGAHAQKTTNYNIILLDKNGEELGVYPWQIPNGVLMNVKFAELPGAGMVYAAPFVGCFGENLIQWRDFILQQDDLAKIASVKIELAD